MVDNNVNNNLKNNTNNIKKEDALNILERTISFISICDNKASIILGFLGVIITIFFSGNGFGKLLSIINITINLKGFWNILLLLLLICSLLTLCFGVYKLIKVLTAKTDCSEFEQEQIDLDSKIYFGNISKNESYKKYKKKLLSLSESELMNDIISQIYLNSIICNKKFNNYNLGMKMSLAAIVAFFLILVIGLIFIKEGG